MKKSDIIKLVKKTIKERRSHYGQHDYYGNNVGGRNSISGFPGVQEDDDFKKRYMTKISPEDFKHKIPVGKIVLYMGSRYKVIGNNGYVLKLQDPKDGETKTVNLNMFSHGGQINEKDMEKMKSKFKKEDTVLIDPLTPTGDKSDLVKSTGAKLDTIDTALKTAKKLGKAIGISGPMGEDLAGDEKSAEREKEDDMPNQGEEEKAEFEKDLADDGKEIEGGVEREREELSEDENVKNAIVGLMNAIGVDSNIVDKSSHELDKTISQKSAWKEKLEALSVWINSVVGGSGSTDQSVSDTPEPSTSESTEENPTNDMGKDNWMDDEGRFAKMQLQKAAEYSVKLTQMLDDMTQLPAWVQSKITRASDYMSMVYHYLDYEMERSNDNLMEHVEKERKRNRLMEGATEKLFKLFNAGKTDSEVRAHYLQMNVDMPESFVAKLRKNWEDLRKTKLDLKLADQEAEGFESIQTQTSSPEVSGMEDVAEKKELASGLFNELKQELKSKTKK